MISETTVDAHETGM